ncbi:aldehyde dehydrogenase family protein [Schumannella sp. 10F1B-5-1]|uniref:aldehyde dehydrogenase family protein n=1 Tax=Schumannella sp. 10F1B-5-1 TaxID=2590780 RepID=UPI0011305667|nr:aldehyde dehydrogenase family protein [Schumannella sp. 10F1B-5-1]TPW73768.1 aldehyde dehydrogenase family protein [Schumannella sp. 10F1B-5-1]
MSDQGTTAIAGAAPDGSVDTVRIDAAIADLERGELAWAARSLAERAELMRDVRAAVAEAAEDWALTAARMKGIPGGSPLEGEEWLSGPYGLLTATALLAESLDRLAAGRSPLDGERLGMALGGRVTVRALPRTREEELLLNGFSAEVWLQPGIGEGQARARAGLGQRHPDRTGGVGLVLGAGNITAIPALDVLSELVHGNRVVLLKPNPVMSAMTPVFARALAPLIGVDALRIVEGAADVGAYLTRHPRLAHVHITGSAASHDAIVFGTGEEGRTRKAAHDPKLRIPISSELGGVSPIVVVPGRWSAADLRYQAEHVATMRLHNAGANCIAGQLVLISHDWPQRERFLTELRRAIDRAPARPDWYPGAADRAQAAVGAHPRALRCGPDGTRVLLELGEAGVGAPVETTEYFAPVLGVVDLPGDAATFLENAVEHVTRAVAGTLGINVIVDPATERRLGRAFDEAIARLRYGTIAINAWTGVAFQTAAAPWGAYPGNRLADVGSGIGTVHNALLIDGVEKTVLRGPFRPFPRSVAGGEAALFPTPPWFVSARSAAVTGRRLVEYWIAPSARRMAAVFAAAFRA